MSETEQRFLIRRGGPLVLVGWVMVGLVLAGCGDRAAPRSARDPLTPEPSSTRPPTATHTPTPPASGKGIPDDFPLALGLVADSETTVGTPRRGVRGVSLEPRCWPGAWPGAAVDRLVVQQSGPELAVTRELAVYPDAAAAAAVGEQVRVDAAHCHRLPGTTHGAAMDVTPLGDVDTGAEPVVASFAETMTGGEPSGSVFVFTQVGRALLAVEDSGEWTLDTAVSGAHRLERADRELVARLCVFSETGC